MRMKDTPQGNEETCLNWKTRKADYLYLNPSMLLSEKETIAFLAAHNHHSKRQFDPWAFLGTISNFRLLHA
jgi:hypothetical protein